MSQQDPEFRNDALNNVFPKVSLCKKLKSFILTPHKGCKMHIQQVWSNWNNSVIWWSLYLIIEHHQWEGNNYLRRIVTRLFCLQIYVLLWFWFVFLSTMSAIQLVWRVFSFTSRSGREFLLKQKTNHIASVGYQKKKINVLFNLFHNF